MAVWIVGVGVVLSPLLLGWLSLWMLRWRSCPATDPRWQILLDRARATLGLRRGVLLLVSPRQVMPMTWGIPRPRLLLPASADTWPAQRTWVVLLHELGHVKRWDCLTKLLGHLACAAYWFNPLAWLAFKQLQTEAEVACDDLVLASGHEPCDYADHLLQVASGLRAGLLSVHSSIALARPSKLEGRLLAILDSGRNRRALTRLGILSVALLVACVVVPISTMKATAAGDKPAASAPAGATKTPPAADASLRAAWAGLLSEQPLTAYDAARTLAKSGKAGVEFLEAMVPVTQPEPARVAKLIDESGSAPEARRQTMVVYALELMNSADARTLLTKMAKGAGWATGPATAALERLSAKPTAVDMSGKKLMLVSWQAVTRPEMVRTILAGAKPIDSGSKDFTALLCDARQLRLAMQPLLPGPDGRWPDLCALGVGEIREPQVRRLSLSSASQHASMFFLGGGISAVCGRDSKGQQLQPIANFHFSSSVKYGFRARDSVAQLEIIAGAPETRATIHKVSGQSPTEVILASPKFKTECPVGQALCLVAGFAEGDCRPQVVLVMEPIAVPVRLAPYFRNSNRWVRGGQEDMVRVAEEGLAWNAMAVDQEGKVNPNWVRTLPNGTQVRIARVWAPNEHPFQTWDGDGNPILCDPLDTSWSSSQEVNVNLDVRTSEKDPWRRGCWASSRSHPPTLRIGMGDGPWQIAETLKLNEPLTIGKQVFTFEGVKPLQRKGLFRRGGVSATMEHGYDADTVWDMGAVDKKGKLVVPTRDLNMIYDSPFSREKVVTYQDNQTTELAIDINDVDHYVLLKRPRQWVTFENFAGAPKLPASFAGSAPATQPAKP